MDSCWAFFEEDPRFFDMSTLGPRFEIEDTPLDAAGLNRAARDVKAQLPQLLTAKIREHRGGIPTMTPDGAHCRAGPGGAGLFLCERL